MKFFLTTLPNLAHAHKRWIDVAGAVWFVVNCADAAQFIDLPNIEFLTGISGLAVSALWNVLWWGVLFPILHERAAQHSDR